MSVAVAERTAAEAELTRLERRLAEGAKAAQASAQRLARRGEQVGAAEGRTVAAQEERDRIEVAAAEARERATVAQDAYDEVKAQVGDGGEDRSGLAAAQEQAAAILSEHAERTAITRTAERESARDLAARRARAETLAEAVRRGGDASAALLVDPRRSAGVTGAFAARLVVPEGYEVAVAAALGAAAEAIAVTGLDAAAAILATLRQADAGSAALVLATSAAPAAASAPPASAS